MYIFPDCSTGQDSYRGNPWRPWTLNLYAYVGNNPVNYVDPTGHEVECNEATYAGTNACFPQNPPSVEDPQPGDTGGLGISASYFVGIGVSVTVAYVSIVDSSGTSRPYLQMTVGVGVGVGAGVSLFAQTGQTNTPDPQDNVGITDTSTCVEAQVVAGVQLCSNPGSSSVTVQVDAKLGAEVAVDGQKTVTISIPLFSSEDASSDATGPIYGPPVPPAPVEGPPVPFTLPPAWESPWRTVN